MAIDPLTAKLLAQAAARAAARAATDEESRRRTLILILAPILGLLLLIAFILYLITSPFSVLSQWLVGDEVSVVENFQKEYGYNQQLGIYEKDYIEGSGQSYEGVVFTDGGREVIYYNQLDERWADTMYGTSGTIGEAGCGPTAMAIVTSTLTGTPHNPVELSEWSVANGHRCEGNGSYHSLIPAAAEAYGLSWESVPPDDPQAMIDALADGKLVVAIMAKGHFMRFRPFTRRWRSAAGWKYARWPSVCRESSGNTAGSCLAVRWKWRRHPVTYLQNGPTGGCISAWWSRISWENGGCNKERIRMGGSQNGKV